ncbi:hypothetical protein SOVF_109500 [Spinacia oleracea]|uniref:NAC domain-containing protein 26-like n=1 Tax=Spinacia oleracea TaxID=3562 RepID=A0ABM3R406_SPIOL|nr:NAC domain-containing protein 26-like [Spinacia oleracea]KNA14175.1 hypothetical protein SOVF_109500 [Spinacia oleracea]
MVINNKDTMHLLDQQTMNFEIPVGFRFDPTEYQLLNYFLNHKISDQELPPYTQFLIKDVDLYKHHPSYFFQEILQFNIEEHEIRGYFFTKLKKAGINSSSKDNSYYNRRVCDDYGVEYGTWTGMGRDPIFDIHGYQIGFDKYLKFSEVGDEKSTIEWKMHEYSFHPSVMPVCSKEEYKDLVICRVDMKMIGNAVKRRASTKNKGLNKVLFLFELKQIYDDNVKSIIPILPSSLPHVDNQAIICIKKEEDESYSEESVSNKKQKTDHRMN